MSAPTIFDTDAEETVAGCAAFSEVAARAFTDRLLPEHFRDPRCWAVVAASLEVPNDRPAEVDAAGGWWREHRIADTAHIPRPVLEDWCQQAPLAYDATARYADRVIAAYGRRQRVAVLLEELAEHGVRIEWEAA